MGSCLFLKKVCFSIELVTKLLIP